MEWTNDGEIGELEYGQGTEAHYLKAGRHDETEPQHALS